MTVEAPRAKASFLDAVERYEPHEWPRHLDEVSGDSPALRSRVEVLLRAHAEAESAGILDKLVRDPIASPEPAPGEVTKETEPVAAGPPR